MFLQVLWYGGTVSHHVFLARWSCSQYCEMSAAGWGCPRSQDVLVVIPSIRVNCGCIFVSNPSRRPITSASLVKWQDCRDTLFNGCPGTYVSKKPSYSNRGACFSISARTAHFQRYIASRNMKRKSGSNSEQRSLSRYTNSILAYNDTSHAKRHTTKTNNVSYPR